MTHLIDKDALVAEIKRRKELVSDPILLGNDLMIGERNAYFNLLPFLDTIEVKEVDLEKEVDDAFLENKCNITDNVSLGEFERIAKHFFELGVAVGNKTQKGEQNMKTGVELIAEERQRQIEVEGWTKEHDAQHKDCELAKAAICYADPNVYYHHENRVLRHRRPNWDFWPMKWDECWFKPTDRIRDLVKAGALIAAEIDRLQAQKGE